MKNKKILTCIIIFFLFGLIITPAITGSLLHKNVNQIEEKQFKNFEKSHFGKENIKNSEKTEYLGKIYGYTHCYYGLWTFDPLAHVVVRIGLKITRSNSNGYYEITGLPLNRTYTVIANHLCYIRSVEKVTLTAEKPEKELYIDMEWVGVLGYIFYIFEQIIKFISGSCVYKT